MVNNVLIVLKEMESIVGKYVDKFNLLDMVQFKLQDQGSLPDLYQRLNHNMNNLTAFIASLTYNETIQVGADVKKNNADEQLGVIIAALHEVLDNQKNESMKVTQQIEPEAIEKLAKELSKSGINNKHVETFKTFVAKEQKSYQLPDSDMKMKVRKATGNSMKSTQWILVVDLINGPQSIIAQGYLELVRTWTVNTTDHWLFDRVGSAGAIVETPFAKNVLKDWVKEKEYHFHTPGQAANKDAITTLAQDKFYFFTPDEPREKAFTLDMLAKHRSRGLEWWMFGRYDYIICFHKQAHKALLDMEMVVKAKSNNPKTAKILKLAGAEWPGGPNQKFRDDPQKVMVQTRGALKNFLKTELNWQRPPIGIADGRCRTKQMIIPETKKEPIGDAIRGMSGNKCNVRIDAYNNVEQLISLTGPKEALPSMELLVKTCL